MLRVAEDHFSDTHTGRQRRANEDAYFARAPLFVVADGMGGAQAGEVASGMAVELFADGLPDGGGGLEQRLAAVVRAANERIYRRSRSDSAHAGMGTTLTAVYVGDEEISIAHVGDSRAYCLRDGELGRLTKDHSLVDELISSGRLTPEEAEHHPQRSVITRALGPESEVEVDTSTHRARPGDVYLLCSDGLTSMVSEQQAAEILRSAPSLREAGRRLIQAANDAGGRDNITVVLFRLEELPDAARAPAAGDDQKTMAGGTALRAEAVQEALAGSSAATARAPSPAPSGARAPAPSDGPASSPAPASASRPLSPPSPAHPRRPRRARPAAGRSHRRRWVLGGVLVVVIGLVAAGAWVASQTVYFIGTDGHGQVTLYQGVPYDLPGGVHLYSPSFVSGVSAAEVAPARRQTLLDHTLRSHSDAVDLMRRLERGQLAAGGSQ
jgi:protein phosphatase